jgi:hypothetical protein
MIAPQVKDYVMAGLDWHKAAAICLRSLERRPESILQDPK